MYTGVECHVTAPCLTKEVSMVFQSLHYFPFLQAVYEDYGLSTSFPAFATVCHFPYCRATGYEVVFCGFDLCFPHSE